MTLKRIIIAATAATVALGAAAPAFAKSRGCKAQIFIQQNSSKKAIETFSARGSDNTANKARKRARGRAQGCARTHYDIRWERKRPETCHPGGQVFDYDLVDIKAAIEKAACKSPRMTGEVLVKVLTYGDKGCNGVMSLGPNYTIKESMC